MSVDILPPASWRDKDRGLVAHRFLVGPDQWQQFALVTFNAPGGELQSVHANYPTDEAGLRLPKEGGKPGHLYWMAAVEGPHITLEGVKPAVLEPVLVELAARFGGEVLGIVVAMGEGMTGSMGQTKTSADEIAQLLQEAQGADAFFESDD